MFNKDFNVINGDRASGKSIFLRELSRVLKKLNYKVCFIDTLGESNLNSRNSDIDLIKVLSESDYNNKRTIQVVKEITERDNYDFILVDDTDYLSESIIESMKNIRVKKIIACTILDNIGLDKKDTYKICSIYNESKLKEGFLIEYHDKSLNIENLEEFYTQSIRDEKLTKILNEK
jgi:hypothetical protein